MWSRYIPLALLLVASITVAEPKQLSVEERALGWRLLFDGESLNGWRNYGGGTNPTLVE